MISDFYSLLRFLTNVLCFDQDTRAAEEAAQHHDSQIQQFERDRESLQASINKLENDLTTARRAQDQLDEQKAENVSISTLFSLVRT